MFSTRYWSLPSLVLKRYVNYSLKTQISHQQQKSFILGSHVKFNKRLNFAVTMKRIRVGMTMKLPVTLYYGQFGKEENRPIMAMDYLQ